MKPQQFRKLKEIKIQVLYLIVNVIHFQQGKDFLPSFFFFSSFFLPCSLLHFSLSLTLSFCLSPRSAVSISLPLSLYLSLCLCSCRSLSPSLSSLYLSLSLLNSIKKGYQSHQFGHFCDMVGRDWLILCNL